jgi:hypothetical protein
MFPAYNVDLNVPYEMYNPIVAILVAAENATALPRLGKPKIKLRVQANQTEEQF